MITNPAIGMKARFYRDNSALNDKLAVIIHLNPWGLDERSIGTEFHVVQIRFEDGLEVSCSVSFLFFISPEDEKDWEAKVKEKRERANHAMRFL